MPSPEGFVPHPRTVVAIRSRLLAWFRDHQRDLPWRRRPEPYAVWVSEMMLQQTQVATVIPYFDRWMQKYPTVLDLAKANEAQVLHSWQGLGYYRRARALHAGAKVVASEHGGVVPRDVDGLRALPGIGAYTAGAIASIAYQLPTPIVDGNVIRVLCRLFAQRGDPAKAPLKKSVWEWAGALVPESDPSAFNQGMMELGALLCKPQSPRCGSCPLRSVCRARRLGIAEELPEISKAVALTSVVAAAAIVRRGSSVLVAKRADDASRWAGLWEFPQSEVRDDERSDDAAARAVKQATGLVVRSGALEAELRHGVTRFRITLRAYACSLAPRSRACASAPANPAVGAEFRWLLPATLEDLPMSAPHRRLARKIASIARPAPRAP